MSHKTSPILAAEQRRHAIIHAEAELVGAQQRGILLPRRRFLQLGGASFVLLSAPLLAGAEGCTAEEVQTAAQIIFLVAQVALLVGEIIEGDVKITSPNAVCRTYDIAMSLVNAIGGAQMDSTQSVRLCEGDNMQPLNQWALTPQQRGQHTIQSMFDGELFTSSPFDVGAA